MALSHGRSNRFHGLRDEDPPILTAQDRPPGTAYDAIVVLVFDTSLLISALRSQGGASFRLLPLLDGRPLPHLLLGRPTLSDPKDDMVLELAVDAGAPVIVTFNMRDFVGIDRFGIRAITPREYLQEIGAVP